MSSECFCGLPWINHAYSAINKIRHERALEVAMQNMDVGRLEEACRHAELAMVATPKISEARAKLVAKVKTICANQLSMAMQHGEANRIEESCERAEAAGVSGTDIQAGRHLVSQLRAQKNLEVAMSKLDAHLIELVCAQAETVGVATIHGRILAQRLHAETSLMDAMEGSDADKLDAACTRAEIARVAASQIQLGRLKAERIRADLQLAEVLHSWDAGLIKQVFSRAKKVGVAEAKLEQAWEKVKWIREHALVAAMRSEDANEIAEACKQAIIDGVAESKIADAQAKLQQLFAESELRGAMESCDPNRIEAACIHAARARVTVGTIKKGRSLWRQLRANDLMAAMPSGNADMIERACDNAAIAEVSVIQIEEGRMEVKRIRAEWDLAQAMTSRNVDSIAEAGDRARSSLRACFAVVSWFHVTKTQLKKIPGFGTQFSNEIMDAALGPFFFSYRTQPSVLAIGRCRLSEAAVRIKQLRTEELSAVMAKVASWRAGTAKDNQWIQENCVAATASQIATEIQEACRRAESAGVNLCKIEAGRLQVRQLREEELSEVIEKVFAKVDMAKDRRALSHTRQSQESEVAMAALEIEEACRRAVIAGVDIAKVETGRLQISRIRADHAVSVAMQSGEVSRIEAACRHAEDVGLDPSRMERAWVTLRRLISTEVRAVSHGTCVDRLKKVSENARLIGVPTATIETAWAQFRQACMSELFSAAQSCDAQQIDKACIKSKEAGVSSKVLEEWCAKSSWLRVNEKFSAAMRSDDVDRMREACENVDAEGAALGMLKVAETKTSVLLEQKRQIEQKRQMEARHREQERQEAEARRREDERRRQEEYRRQKERERRDMDERRQIATRSCGGMWWCCGKCQRRLVQKIETELKPDEHDGYSCRTRSHPSAIRVERWKPRMFDIAYCSSCGQEVGAIDLNTDEFCLKAKGLVVDEIGFRPKRWKDVARSSR